MVKKILFLDLDGTLLDDSKHITQGNHDALKRILVRGHGVVITTGRPLTSAMKQAEILGLDQPGCYLIAYNGAVIYDWSTRQEIFSKTISLEDTVHIFDMANRAGVHIQTYDDRGILVEEQCQDEALEKYSKFTQMTYRVIENVRTDLEKAPIKCLAIDWADQTKLRQIQAQIQAERSDRLDAFFSCDAYLEIVSAGINKGEAVRMLCKVLNVPVDHTVAVGDAANDIPMIEAAGIGVAMCNGTDEVKAVADDVTTRDNNHDGVAQVIDRYFDEADCRKIAPYELF